MRSAEDLGFSLEALVQGMFRVKGSGPIGLIGLIGLIAFIGVIGFIRLRGFKVRVKGEDLKR